LALIGSVSVVAATVTRAFTGSFTEAPIPGAEMLITRLRAPHRTYTIHCTFSAGASDLASMLTLDGYINSQMPIWIDWSEAWGECQAFGYLVHASPTYTWPSAREVDYTFVEVPAWGRLYLNVLSGYQITSCEATGGWNAHVGPEMAPALTSGNWTLGTGWSYGTSPNVLNTSGSGVTGTAQPATALSVVVGNIYCVTVTVSSVTSGGFYVTLGGVACPNITAAGTYTYYITATSTGNLIFTVSSSTSQFTISAVSVTLSPALSVATSGQRPGLAGCTQLAVSAITSYGMLVYTLPRAADFTRYHGFTIWLQLSSLTNASSFTLYAMTDMNDYYSKTITILPNRTGAWVQIGCERDIMAATGSPAWNNIAMIAVGLNLSGSFTGNVLINDLRSQGVGENVFLYDLNYASLGQEGVGKQGVTDILSPLWSPYGWALDRVNLNWQEQLYLVNEQLKHIPCTINDCESTTGWTCVTT
jgi:hypothetical protein